MVHVRGLIALVTYDQLLKHYGTQRKAAAAIGVSKQAVSLWKRKGIPLKFQFDWENASNGKLRAARPEQFKPVEARP